MKLKKMVMFGLIAFFFQQANAQDSMVASPKPAPSQTFRPAPKFSFNIPLGYTLDESASFDQGKLTAVGGFQYGGAFEFFSSPSSSIELSYQRMATTFPLFDKEGNDINETDPEGSLNYILLGGNKYIMKPGSKAMPYFGAGAGVGIMNSKGQSSTNFAFNMKLGVKVPAGKSAAFKLQAYAQSMTATFGSDYAEVGDGGIVYPDRVFLFQFGLGGVLCFDR
ncbi:MAG: hypothetical protein MUE71_07745 [Chitinophagaceae bacterium]|nr:hypothetical protein [Chitinophagaceae bacterium]